jgi:hypothetical protein
LRFLHRVDAESITDPDEQAAIDRLRRRLRRKTTARNAGRNGGARTVAMNAMLKAPVSLVEAMAELRFPPKTDQRLQRLMDRNTEGRLTRPEREELEALVELSEQISLLRAQALRVLGRKPG